LAWFPFAAALAAVATACSAHGGGGGRGGGDAATEGPDASSGLDASMDDAAMRDAASRRDGPGERGDGGTDVDAGCEQTVPIEIERIAHPPDLLLVVDESSSMLAPVDEFNITGPRKWQAMHSALEMVTASNDEYIHFGLMPFPASDTVCDAGQVQVEIAPRNASAIATELSNTRPADEGATPTHATLEQARSYYESIPENENGQFVLLATDGLPNCAPTKEDDGSDESITAIEELRADGVKTYVLGFKPGLLSDTSTLSDMAEAGGTGSHFTADSPAELESTLREIATEIIPPSCTFELAGPERNPERLRVEFDGDAVPRDPSHSQGWDYQRDDNTITFYGGSCDTLQAGDVSEINVDFGCPGPVI
jgi:hypothetical protein